MWLLFLACAPTKLDVQAGSGWVGGPAAEASDTAADTDTGVSIEEGEIRPPIAVIVVPDTSQVGTRVVFDGSASFDPYGDPISAYAWNCSDGSVGSKASLSLIPASTGKLRCTLTVTAPSGKDGSADGTVRIVSMNRMSGPA